MQKPYTGPTIHKALVPVTPHSDTQVLLNAARLVIGSGQIQLIGLVGVSPGRSLSTGALAARKLRTRLHERHDGEQVWARQRVRVSHEPWEEFLGVVEEEQPDLLLLEWPVHFEELQVSLIEALVRPPCDLLLVRGPLPERPESLLVPLRESPYAESTLRLALAVARQSSAQVTTLRLKKSGDEAGDTGDFRGLAQVLQNLPEVNHIERTVEDYTAAILEAAPSHDLIVLGAAARPLRPTAPAGMIAEQVLNQSQVGVMVIKKAQLPPETEAPQGRRAISILVDKWFAENTFHADEFADLHYLLQMKQEQNLTISLALPALNEQETVGEVIETVKDALVDEVPLLDEIVLMDSDSSDRTREIAASLGVPVYIHQQVLPDYGPRPGKGEALWKSLFVTRGDLLVWVDTDIVNIHPRFVYGLIGPLLANPKLKFIKGFYRRPLKVGEKVQAGGGGRVTELTARPLLNLFYPELSGIIQPLSGEYGGRRSALEKLAFYSGYGVETGLLIDVFEKFGLQTIAQVDLQERIHHNQPLESLSKMSFAIIQVVIDRLEKHHARDMLEEINQTMKLIRYENGRLFLDVEEIAELDRPPMVEIPEYRERLGR